MQNSILPRRVTYHEPKYADMKESIELRGYLGRILGRVPKCRVLQVSDEEFKLGVRYKQGNEIECKSFLGFENVRDELKRLVDLVE